MCYKMQFLTIIIISLFCIPINCGKFNPTNDIICEIYSRDSKLFRNLTLQVLNETRQESKSIWFNGDIENDLQFDPKRPTRVFIHGYYSNRDTIQEYANAYLETGDFNFIAIDWLAGAQTLDYRKARSRVRTVGKITAQFINHLVDLGLDLNDLILVGHSLGNFIKHSVQCKEFNFEFNGRRPHMWSCGSKFKIRETGSYHWTGSSVANV